MSFWRGRRALVTGATGLVGSWLAKALVQRGASVAALVLDEDPTSDFIRSETAARCTIVRGNLASIGDCARAINATESEFVFHLGAQTLVGSAVRDPFETFESNVRGTYNLLEASRRLGTGIRGIVVASSDKAYGDAGGAVYHETMPLAGNHPYDVSKSCADLIASTYARTYGMPIAIARCGNIYGGGDGNWSRIVPGTIRSILFRERPVLRSDGTLVRDYIYVEDVVTAYLALAESLERAAEPGEAFNFSTESRVSVLEIVAHISACMGVSPDPDIRAEATFEIPAQTLSSAKARERLGWRPEWSLEAGLIATIAWYRALFDGETRGLLHALR